MSFGRETRKAKASQKKSRQLRPQRPSTDKVRRRLTGPCAPPRAPKPTHHEFQNVVNPKASRASHPDKPAITRRLRLPPAVCVYRLRNKKVFFFNKFFWSKYFTLW